MSEIRTNELNHSTGASAISVDELGNVTLSANLQVNGQSNLLPDPANKAGQFLTTDGSTLSYQPIDLITYSIALG
jgi:hypothetical protein